MPHSLGRIKKTELPGELLIRGEAGGVKIEAAQEEKTALRRFSMTAYTGGAMSLGGWPHPVVVDLSGLALGKKSRPILMEHDAKRIVGHTDAVAIEKSTLLVSGVISGVGEAAREVIGASDNGFPWQASLGASARKVVFIPENKTATVNGREFAGPAYIVRQSRLGEVSFVALGADDNTTARVEASGAPVEVMTMDFENWVKAKGFVLADLSDEQVAGLKAMLDKEAAGEPALVATTQPVAPVATQPAPAIQATAASKGAPAAQSETEPVPTGKAKAEEKVRAEASRVAAIQAMCRDYPDLAAEAIRSGASLEETGDKVVLAMRERIPLAQARTTTRSDARMDGKVLEAALLLRARFDTEALEKSYAEPVLEAAYKQRGLGLERLFVTCARMEGREVHDGDREQTIRAGFSTLSLPGILNNVASKALLRRFEAQPIVATRLCSEGELSDFKEAERYRLTDVGDLEPIAPDGEIKHGGLSEEKATNKLGTYGKIITHTREMIYNDDLDAFLKVPEGMGARAARKIDQLFFERLLSNPNNLFSAGHKNYKAGADTALSATALQAAIQLFLQQVDADGQPINVEPRFLVVPPELKMTARELVSSQWLLAVGATNKEKIATYNALQDENLTPVTSPYLSNPNYAGSSGKAWYLFGDPQVVDTFEIGYLLGQKTPKIEQGEVDFNRLGISFRVVFDLGVREQDWRGMAKFKGEA